MEMPDMRVWLSGAALLRLALVLYGEWQDRTMAVKFTDVDYYVFNDAARFVTLGQSPYNRATFRYTPLLAWALTPNILLHHFFGKLLFIVFDILSGHLIYSIVRHSGTADKTATICSLLWLLNPLPMVVSSRGNAESLMAFLVLQTIRLLQGRRTVLAALVFALAVHVKIYPVTYALGVYLYLGYQDEGENGTDRKVCTDTDWTEGARVKPKFGSSLAEGYRSGPLLGSRSGQRGVRSGSSSLKMLLWTLRPTWIRVKFGLVAGLTLLALTAVFYAKYGWVFLYETYLYHVVRKDIRHNFSPYFYMLYLTGEDETSVVIKFLTFLPQALLLVGISLRYHRHLPLCFFLCTFSFVMLNKVCTSQYFLWYLCLLPLLVPRLRMGWRKTAILAFLWFLAQGLWLLPAYYLEFEGQNTFFYIWLAGLFFFMVNVAIVCAIIMNYDYAKSCPSLSKME